MEPANIGWIGSDPLWVWFGNPWLPGASYFQEKFPNACLRGKLYDALRDYATSMDIYKGYKSKEAALKALENAKEAINPATWNGSGI